MVTFGSRAGENIKQDTARKATSGFIRNLKDGEDLRVRFLTESQDFWKYREHYSDTVRFFPCTEEDDCPGCTSEIEKTKRYSRRYLAKVLIVKEGKVEMLKLPLDLANRLASKQERNNGTLLDRDFLLIREGKGLDSTYDVENFEPQPVDVSRYLADAPDYSETLMAQFEDAFGTKQAQSMTGSRPAQSRIQPQTHQAASTMTASTTNGWAEGDGPIPFDRAPVTEQAEEPEYTESQLRSKSPDELVGLCPVPIPDTVREGGTNVIVDWMIEQFAS